MIRYLLDTDITSQAGKQKPNENVQKWLASVNDDELAISVITLRSVWRGWNVPGRRRRRPPLRSPPT